MARITVEDCVKIIPNRFELCLIASNRAKNILSGAPTAHNRKEKAAVISLREIADEELNIEIQKENIVRAYKNQSAIEQEPANQEVLDAIAAESESSISQNQDSDVAEKLTEGDFEAESKIEESYIGENIAVED